MLIVVRLKPARTGPANREAEMNKLRVAGECVCALAIMAATLAVGYGAMHLMASQAIVASSLY